MTKKYSTDKKLQTLFEGFRKFTSTSASNENEGKAIIKEGSWDREAHNANEDAIRETTEALWFAVADMGIDLEEGENGLNQWRLFGSATDGGAQELMTWVYNVDNIGQLSPQVVAAYEKLQRLVEESKALEAQFDADNEAYKKEQDANPVGSWAATDPNTGKEMGRGRMPVEYTESKRRKRKS